MIGWESYYTATSLEDVLRLLADRGPDARVIAGGTDLLVEIPRGRREVGALVDVTRIGGLDRIWLDDDGEVHIGPAVTHNLALSSELLVSRGFPLAMACWQVGTPQLRNRGTIVGNLVTASPANDTITALSALDGQLLLESVGGQRRVSMADFFQGVRESVLAPDEMVVDLTFPALAANQCGVFVKLALRHTHAIAVASVAILLTLDEQGGRGGEVQAARIALGAVAPTVIRAGEAEDVLVGASLDEEVIETAANLAAESASPIDDVRGGAVYRRHAVTALVRRALRALASGRERDWFPPAPPRLWGRTDGRFRRLAGKTICHQAQGDEPVESVVNGQNVSVRGAGGKTLLTMLREDLGLTGTKEGCAEGECGACTVWLDGIAVLACMTPAARAHGTQVVTVEGLSDGDALHPVQQAFIDAGAVQCGYCTPGFVMASASLLDEIPQPTRKQIRAGLAGNLCRCTGYAKIVQAVEQAARR